jgi:hypothetical protein
MAYVHKDHNVDAVTYQSYVSSNKHRKIIRNNLNQVSKLKLKQEEKENQESSENFIRLLGSLYSN